MKNLSTILESAEVIGGGAAAGFLDMQFAGKGVAGLGPGALLGVVGVGLGITGVGGHKIAKHALALGTGAAAFEVGRMVATKVGTQTVSGVRGVRGVGRVGGVAPVGALPNYRAPLSYADLQAQFETLRYRAA